MTSTVQFITTTALALLISTGCMSRTVYVKSQPAPDATYPEQYDMPDDDVEFIPEDVQDTTVFYDALSPHGRWVMHNQYGRVFLPAGVTSSWQPYTNGQWLYTSYGWTWRSNSPFGWATSHYGRWGYQASLGWYWVPGTTWGPAWVSWRTGTYMGWAPLSPSGVAITVGATGWVFSLQTDFYSGRRVRYIRHTHRSYRSCFSNTRTYQSERRTYRGRYYAHGPDRRTRRIEHIRRDPRDTIHRSHRTVHSNRQEGRRTQTIQDQRQSRDSRMTPRERPQARRDGNMDRNDRNRNDDRGSDMTNDGRSRSRIDRERSSDSRRSDRLERARNRQSQEATVPRARSQERMNDQRESRETRGSQRNEGNTRNNEGRRGTQDDLIVEPQSFSGIQNHSGSTATSGQLLPLAKQSRTQTRTPSRTMTPVWKDGIQKRNDGQRTTTTKSRSSKSNNASMLGKSNRSQSSGLSQSKPQSSRAKRRSSQATRKRPARGKK